MKSKIYLVISILTSLFFYSQKNLTFFTEKEQKEISGYGNSGCLFSTYSSIEELLNNQIFIIEIDQVYFVKIDTKIYLLSQKKSEGNEILAENYFYKMIIDLDQETKGTVKLIDKNVYGSEKEEVILATKINRSCGD